ncbi:antitoxin Xre/MbcA/ParS toxin-binding domain-containing protein [Prosthecobacter sp.]|uniref:type II RES/Xre toxin-antitoxin system antitoxin n=1 Tax=Prosthecobacter sp. TaxID=1965333 RepID=UPI0037839B18
MRSKPAHHSSKVQEVAAIYITPPTPTASKGTRKVSSAGGGGIVASLAQGQPGRGGAGEYTLPRLIESLKAGLPVQELHDLRSSLDLPMESLVPMLGISKATLHRRMAAGRLDAAESDRVIRFARLMGRAVGVMESTENARRWLAAPQRALGGAVPLEYAETEVGAREVEDLLGRIEYGVYS